MAQRFRLAQLLSPAISILAASLGAIQLFAQTAPTRILACESTNDSCKRPGAPRMANEAIGRHRAVEIRYGVILVSWRHVPTAARIVGYGRLEEMVATLDEVSHSMRP